MIASADRPALPDVTLVAVTSVALGPTLTALQQSMLQAKFAKVLFLSDRRSTAARFLKPGGSRVDSFFGFRASQVSCAPRLEWRATCRHISGVEQP